MSKITFSKLPFSKKNFRTLSECEGVSIQIRTDIQSHSVSLGLGPSCLQRLLADTKSPLLAWKELDSTRFYQSRNISACFVIFFVVC